MHHKIDRSVANAFRKSVFSEGIHYGGILLIGIALALTAAERVEAASVNATWSGTDGQWTDSQWNFIPTPGSQINYPNNNNNYQFDIQITKGSVDLLSTAPSVTVNSGIISNRDTTLNVSGSTLTVGHIDLSNNSTLAISNGGSVTTNGVFSDYSTVDIKGTHSTLNINGNLEQQEASTHVSEGASLLISGNALESINVTGNGSLVNITGFYGRIFEGAQILDHGKLIAGSMDVSGGPVEIATGGSITVNQVTTSGEVNVDGGELNVNNYHQTSNDGTTTISNGGDLTLSTTFPPKEPNNNKIQLDSGNLTVTDNSKIELVGGTYQQTGGNTGLIGSTILGGHIKLSGWVFSLDGGLTKGSTFEVSGGKLEGKGEIRGDLTVTGGTVAPGLSPGTLTVSNYTQSDGILEIEIASLADFDKLNVTNDASLTGGEILFKLINGYLPRTGDVFDFLTAGNLLNFSNLHFGVIGGVGGFSISPNMGVNGSIEFVAQTNFYVSEPTTITLFSFGLFGIGLSRRRTQPLSRVATLLKFKLIK